MAGLENVALSFCHAAERQFEASRNCPDENLRALASVASLHFHQSVVLGGHLVRRTEYAQAIAVIRLSLDSLAAVEATLVDSESAWQQFRGLVDDKTRSSDIRAWLDARFWVPGDVRDVWGNPLGRCVKGLSTHLNPYAHFSGPLMQWHMKMVLPPGSSQGRVAIGRELVDAARTARLEALIGFLIWLLGRAVVEQAEPGGARDELASSVQELATWLTGNEWLLGGRGWNTVLMPHVYDA